MSLETRILAFINAVGADIKALYAASGGGGVISKNTTVNFTTSKNNDVFIIADTDVLATSKIQASIALRADTFDNCGDDMDEMYIRCMPLNGSIKMIVGHTDDKQKVLGTFSINYSIN
jgi:hypothetical protein